MFIKREGQHQKPVKDPFKKMDKKTQVKKLEEELDEVFSIWIRTQDIDNNGMGNCYTCGKPEHWKKLQCGHYLSRRYKGTRWEEKNAKPQCVKCNIFHQGNGPAFARNLINEYGPNILDQLEIMKNRIFKGDPFSLNILIQKFQRKE